MTRVGFGAAPHALFVWSLLACSGGSGGASPRSIVLSLNPPNPSTGAQSIISLTVIAKNADGNAIIGPGTYFNGPITISDSDTSGATLLSLNGGPYASSVASTSPSDALTVKYNGSSTLTSATFTANISPPLPTSDLTSATLAPVGSTSTPTSAPTSTPVPTPTPPPRLPPMGVYNSCEPDTALTSLCEPEDAAMVSDGYTVEVNFIGIAAHKTGANSLAAWLAYDASIGMRQILNVKDAIKDSNPLTGTSLLAFGSIASDCGATNNEQVISCIASVVDSSPAFYGWYIYDEPGCPSQTIGYCAGSLAGGNYQNIQTLASYIKSIDSTHPVIGANTSGGVPCTGGGYNCASGQTQINNLYSWLTASGTPYTGYDYYPIPGNIGISNGGHIDDIGVIAGLIANTIAANYAPEKMVFVAQAFSWYQERDPACTSITVCPFPTTSQMQEMRDQALYYANKAGNPLSVFLWYYWPDITCNGNPPTNYTGCNATANRASVKSAAFAPFPATPPP